MNIRALVLIRVSGTKQQHGQSLESQETRAMNFAIQECGFSRKQVKIFYEVFTGAKQNRPDFERMMSFAEKHHSTIEKVIITDIDRFTRAGVPFYEEAKTRLAQLNIQLIDIFGVIQPPRNHLQGTGEGFGEDLQYEWSYFSPSEGEEARRAQESKSERRNILIRTIPKLVENIKNGYEARQANYGYRNIKIIDPKTGRRIATCEPDQKESPFVVKMYKLRISGISDLEACKKLNQDGYRSRPFRKWKTDHQGRKICVGFGGQKPLSPYQMKETIRNPRYAGFKCEKWTWGKLVKAHHKPLVSIELWNQANQDKFKIVPLLKGGYKLLKLENQIRQYTNHNPDFPLKQVIKCPTCESNVKGAYSRGKTGIRFPLYFCNRKHKQVSINPNELKQILFEEIEKMRFFQDTKIVFKDSFTHLLVPENEYSQHAQKQREEKLENLRSQVNVLVQNLAHISMPELIKETEKNYRNIKSQIENLESVKPEKIKLTPAELDRLVLFCQKLVEHPAKYILNPDNQRILEPLWNMIFKSKPTIKDIKGRTLNWSNIIRYFDEPEKTISGVASHNIVESKSLVCEIKRWSDLIAQILEILED